MTTNATNGTHGTFLTCATIKYTKISITICQVLFESSTSEKICRSILGEQNTIRKSKKFDCFLMAWIFAESSKKNIYPKQSGFCQYRPASGEFKTNDRAIINNYKNVNVTYIDNEHLIKLIFFNVKPG